MNNFSTIILLLVIALFHSSSSQLSSVQIKSHKLLTEDIKSNGIRSIYEANESRFVLTSGQAKYRRALFYSSKEKNIEIEFDLGKNYLIDHFLIKMERDVKRHNLSILVGNSFNGKGKLLYTCLRAHGGEKEYKCEPKCGNGGIIARRFILELLVPQRRWISVKDIQVTASTLSNSSNIISNNRLTLPLNCQNGNKTTTRNTITDILFEKSYIVTEIEVEFENKSLKTIDLILINDQDKNHNLSINLSGCLSKNSMFTCKINSKTFPSRQVKIVTAGLTKIFIRGKPVFYPKLEMKTSVNVKENLRMTCSYSQCDLSVHSDCSEEAIKSGVKFDCVNKRLIRMPSGKDLDSYVIVNNGKVKPVWQNTKFSVDSSNDDSMVVSMPRGYQYFGQYKCACTVPDMVNTEISSDVSVLKNTDFIKDLFFQTLVQYKLSDNEDDVFHNVSNNIIYLPKTGFVNSYFPVEITLLSLIKNNEVYVVYPRNETHNESGVARKSVLHYVKAFEDIHQSWTIATNKYVISEIYPEFVHGSGISIYSNNSNSNLIQKEFIRMLDEDRVKIEPSVLSTMDNKTMKVEIMYASNQKGKLYLTEKTCINKKETVLAIFTKDLCKATDERLSCLQFNNATLVSFNDKIDYSKEVVLDLIAIKTNTSIERVIVKSNVTLEQADVIIKPQYISLDSSVENKTSSVLRVELDIISKKIQDFIPCGNVLIKIEMPNKDIQEMVLQKSKFVIDVEMEAKEVNIIVSLSIAGIQGKHVTNLQLIDPTSLSAKNVQFQEDKTLNVFWHGIDAIAKDLLESYELKIDTTMIACNITTKETKSVPKSDLSETKNFYKVPLKEISQNHLTRISVSIQPILIGNKRGQIKRININFNNIAPTILSIDSIVMTKERTITVLPSQSDLSCGIKEVKFNVTGFNVEKFQWKSETLDKLKYKITNLIPGRKYLLTAKVIYKYGSEDSVSKLNVFETADDVTILSKKHITQINKKVNISCIAEIGPKDKFIKMVQWLRVGKFPLPDGVKSHISAYNPRVAFLIMEEAKVDISGEYMCLARPSASVGSKTIIVGVDDLVVSPQEKQVDFTNSNETVTVTCSSSARGETYLVWIDPLGFIIPEGESEKYSLNNTVTDQNVYNATLTIKKISFSNSGHYKCYKHISNITIEKEFLLYGNESLKIETLPQNSFFVGDKLRLRCKAEAGSKNQKVMWDTSNIKNETTTSVKTSFPYLSDETVQDIEIINSLSLYQVTCTLLPSLKVDQEPLSKTFPIILQSKIVVQGPKEVNIGKDVKLTCLGYPTCKNMKLKWIFYQKKENSTGEIVKISDDFNVQSPSEPIKLELNLSSITPEESGRYECKFSTETRGVSGLQLGKSLSLTVNSLSQTVEDGPRKSALSTMFQSSFTVAVPLLLFSLLY